jgi:hypothetical protein
MGAEHSYKITLSNNKTEKQAIDYLLSVDNRFLLPTKEGRKAIAEKLKLEKSFTRTYDLIMVEGRVRGEDELTIIERDVITLVEIKSTLKKLSDNPHGFFFGATENEFKLAERLDEQFRFCFVCLHPDKPSFVLLSLADLKQLIVTKRIQYQINLK